MRERGGRRERGGKRERGGRRRETAEISTGEREEGEDTNRERELWRSVGGVRGGV